MLQSQIYPYLLKGKVINQPNQVWAADITYMPMEKGFGYLIAIMGWHSRKVLSWRLSNTMDADFCVQGLEAAIQDHGCPQLFKEKALAEAAALLIQQKKFRAFWEDEVK